MHALSLELSVPELLNRNDVNARNFSEVLHLTLFLWHSTHFSEPPTLSDL
jgi:hypothetical protein